MYIYIYIYLFVCLLTVLQFGSSSNDQCWASKEHILRGGALCAWCLVAAIHKMDCSDILLPSDQAKEFHSLLIQHLLHWQGLAQHYQYSQHVKRWKLRPKHHDCEHLAKFVAQTRINPRHTACWQDESYLGQIKKIAVHCHMSSVLLRVFQRLILNLSQRWHTERSQTQGSWEKNPWLLTGLGIDATKQACAHR